MIQTFVVKDKRIDCEFSYPDGKEMLWCSDWTNLHLLINEGYIVRKMHGIGLFGVTSYRRTLKGFMSFCL